MNSKITFTKVREVKSPSRAYGENDSYAAGTDFFVPEYSRQLVSDITEKNPNRDEYSLNISPNLDKMTITIMPHGKINIPSGIKVFMEDSNTCLLAVNKSGIASKKALIAGAALVDNDYRNEIHINLLNVSDNPVTISTGDKVIQFMHLPVFYPTWSEVTNKEYSSIATETERNLGGFGSSGTT